MHLFLYQAARHEAPSNQYSYHNNRIRYKQGTIRGDFDLALLKKGIRGRYRILPHGEHDFQKVLTEIDLQEEFYGHIVEIEEARNAVWFKLNYDQVGRNVTKYIGGWRDLSADDVSSMITEYKTHRTALSVVNGQLGQVRYQYSQISSLVNGMRNRPLACMDGMPDKIQVGVDALSEAFTKLTNEADYIKSKMEACQNVVRGYLKERKL